MNPPLRAALLAACCALSAGTASAQTPEPWPLAGRQGLMLLVIVPAAQATDASAYQAQLKQLCPGDRTCFVNFYTNSTGAEASVPLPDAIDREATATFRRSVKQGAESFRWSCRMQLAVPNCF